MLSRRRRSPGGSAPSGSWLLLFAGTLVVAGALPGHAGAGISNGSFETADYSGWVLIEDSPIVCWGTWGIAADGQTIIPDESTFDFNDQVSCEQTSPGLPITYSATDGSHVAYQLQHGPELHRMHQDVAIPLGTSELSWDMQYENHHTSFEWGSQYLAVHLRDTSDRILTTLFQTAPGDRLSIPMSNFTANVSAFAGMTVRIDVELQVQLFYFDAAFDNFRLLVTCGDGVAGPGEECDDGSDNGTTASCCAATCAFVTSGDSCDDGDACTETDTCDGGGMCMGSDPVVCTPLDQCHDAGTCDPGTGVCADPEKPDGNACNDGDACTRDDTCQAGVCEPGEPTLLMPLADPDQAVQCVEQTVGDAIP